MFQVSHLKLGVLIMAKAETEFVPIKAVEPENPSDPHYRVKVVKPFLVGNRLVAAGEVVRIPERSARDAIRCGAAVGTALSPTTLLFETPAEAPKPAPVETPAQKPNAELIAGTCFVGDRSYGPSDGAFFYPGDLLMRLAEQDPVEGSLMEIYVQKLGRNRPVFRATYQLSISEKRRLANLRRSPDEPSEVQIAQAKHTVEMAAF
jgi:hypothetical protein